MKDDTREKEARIRKAVFIILFEIKVFYFG